MVRIALFALLLAVPAAAAPVFGVRTDLPAPINPNDVAIADVDGNGTKDIVLVSPGNPPSQGQITTWYGRGDGYFWPGPTSACGKSPGHLKMIDVDGDSVPDVLVIIEPGLTKVGAIEILRGAGDGSFTSYVQLLPPSLHSYNDAEVADLDLDGKLDVVAAHSLLGGGSTSEEATVHLLKGEGVGQFAAPVTLGYAGRAYGIAVGDLDGNGTPDLALADDYWSGSFLLQSPLGSWTLANGPYITEGIRLANFDGDVLPDQVYLTGGPQVRVRTTNPANVYDLPLVASPRALTARDLDADGIDDLLTSVELPPSIEWRRGHGDGTFEAPVAYAVGTRPISVAGDDLNGDGLVDLVVSNNGGSSVTVLLQGNPVIGAEAGTERFAVARPFPNPSHGAVTLGFELRVDDPVTILVHDVRGRIVESHAIHHPVSGAQNVRLFENAQPAAGLYFATFHQRDNVVTRSFVVLP